MDDQPTGARVGEERRAGRAIGMGCLLAIPGFFGGGMIGALVAKTVGSIQRCRPAEGFPACNVWSYVLPFGIVGALLLSGLITWRLSRRAE